MRALEISEKDFLIGARKVIQKSMLLSIAREAGLTLKELSSYLLISTLSIQEKELSQFIAPDPSESALYISKLFKSGNEIFGSMEEFHNWLNIKNSVMGGEMGISV